ncbi:MAG: transporter [Solirubrobacterales bacterium]|jgi:ABC-2 type transport system permease protein|nr:transporter [Solirubrobacterales bacterium]
MAAGPVAPIARQNARLLLGNPGPLVLFFFTPLLTMAVMRPTFQRVLVGQGFTNANGAEQVIPGFITFFVFFWVVFIGRNFFAEHGWGTWQRLQTSFASPADIVIGKIFPAFCIVLLQVTLLFAIGAVLFDLDSAGPVASLLIVGVALAACVVAFTIALVGLVRLSVQLDALGNLLVMVFAALGGALVPVALLPAWGRAISPAVPSYWANKAARSVILEGQGLSAVWGPAGVLALFALAFAFLAMMTFRVSQAKVTAG